MALRQGPADSGAVARRGLKPQIFTDSYYFHVYVVCCDVHFRYSDDAFMWTV